MPLISMRKVSFSEIAKSHGMTTEQFVRYVIKHKDKFPTSIVSRAMIISSIKGKKRKK